MNEEKQDILKILPFLGSILVACGVLKLIIYYKIFNISIIDYLEFSEILTSFLEDIVFIAIISAASFIFVFLDEKWETHHKNLSKDNNEGSPKTETSKRKRLPIEAIILLLLLMFVLCFSMYKTGIHISRIGLIVLYFLSYNVYFVITIKIIKKYILIYKRLPNLTYYFTGIFICMIALFVIFSAVNKSLKVKYEKLYYGVKFQIDDSLIISDSLNYYIGKTQNYLFAYNEKNNETNVIPMSRIKMISFPKRK